MKQGNAWRAGNYQEVFRIRDLLGPLHNAMFLETNPAPAKYGVSLLGRCENSVRLPLVTVTEDTQVKVKAVMSKLGLLG